LYIADFGNTRIRKVNLATQNITTVAGFGQKCASSTNQCGANDRIRLVHLTPDVTVPTYTSDIRQLAPEHYQKAAHGQNDKFGRCGFGA
jgi:hypothetical protein